MIRYLVWRLVALHPPNGRSRHRTRLILVTNRTHWPAMTTLRTAAIARLALIVVGVLLLAGCGGGTTDVTACEKAMRKQLSAGIEAQQNGTRTTGTKPRECNGLSDAELEKLLKKVTGEELTKRLAGTTSTSEAELPTETTEETTSNEPEIARHQLGETAEFSSADGSVSGSLQVQSVTSRKKTNSEYGEKPQHGRYVEVLIVATGGAGTYSINPYDFYLIAPDGTRFEYASGNGFSEEVANPINATELKPGEKLRGRILFDASPAATVLGYAPSFGSETIATWTLTK